MEHYNLYLCKMPFHIFHSDLFDSYVRQKVVLVFWTMVKLLFNWMQIAEFFAGQFFREL